MQRVVRVFGPEACENLPAKICFPVTVRIFYENEIRFFRYINPSVAQNETKRDV